MTNTHKTISENLNNDLQKLSKSFDSLKEVTSQIAIETHAVVKTLKETLQDTTFRFFSVIDSVNDIIVIKNAEGKWQTLNAAAKKLYGFSFHDFFGKTDKELSIEFPEHKFEFLNCIISDEKAWNSKTFYRETESFKLNEQILYFDIIKTPRFNDDGTRKELIVIGRDITEIKEKGVESKSLTNVLNISSDIVFIIDTKGRITFCNDTFMYLFKFERVSNALGVPIQTLGLNKIYDSISSNVQSNKIWSDIIKLIINSISITGLYTVTPMINDDHTSIFYICTLKLF